MEIIGEIGPWIPNTRNMRSRNKKYLQTIDLY
jgi:hypothetical protein